MSKEARDYVWQHSELRGSLRLLALAIAEIADRNGVAFPGIARLARDIRMSERTTQRLVARLGRSGEISVRRNAGPRGTHLFQIRMTKNLSLFPVEKAVGKAVPICHPVKLSGVRRGPMRVTNRTQRGDTAMSPEPLNQELNRRPATTTTVDKPYQPPAAADLKFPQGTPERLQRAYLVIAEQHQLSREQLQLAFDEVNDRLARRERVDSPVMLVRAIAGQIGTGTFYGARAERHAQAERGGGRPLSAAEAALSRKKAAA